MKKVAVIQDLSSFGKCSLTAAIPVLSVMGVQACPLPTAILTAQTEYPSFFYEDLTAKMHHYTEEWSKLNESFDGIYTGFVTGKEQIDNIFAFLEKFHSNPSTLLVDPVMGDGGEVYKLFTDELLDRMKELVRRADVLTPNLTECCLLTGISYERLHQYDEQDYMKAIEEAGKILQQQTKAQIIITGIHPPSATPVIGNMYVDGDNVNYRLTNFNGKSYSGTGDLFASVIVGGLVRGERLETSVQLAETFVAKAIEAAYNEQIPEIEGVPFERYLGMLLPHK